jgi:hypothetical protein
VARSAGSGNLGRTPKVPSRFGGDVVGAPSAGNEVSGLSRTLAPQGPFRTEEGGRASACDDGMMGQ